MKTSEVTDKLLPALLAARKAMKPAFKAKKNDHFRYQYANEEAWHDAVQPALQANDLYLSFSADDCQRVGTLTTVRGHARVTHVSGQWFEVSGVGEGEDKADKAAYKAQTGLKKYLYALAFALPTTDDAEDPANDRERAAQEIAKAGAGKTQAQINGDLVQAGLDPQQASDDLRSRAKALYEELFQLDKPEAKRIKSKHGTDYEAMIAELTVALHVAHEGPEGPIGSASNDPGDQ